MVNRSTLKTLLGLISLGFLCACSAGTSGGGNAAGGFDVFANRIQPIFDQSCSCHGQGAASTEGSGLLLAKAPADKVYQSVINSPNGVKPGDPDNSKLIQSILQAKMPTGGGMEKSDAVKLLIAWVKDGAHRYGADVGGVPDTGGREPTPPEYGFGVAPEVYAEAQKFKYEFGDITNTAPGQFPVVKLRVVNPTKAPTDPDYVYKGLRSVPVEDPAKTKNTPPWYIGTASVSLLIGWNTGEYENVGSGAKQSASGQSHGGKANPGQPVSIAVLKVSSQTPGAVITEDSDGWITVTSPVAVPAGATGSGVVALNGHPGGPLTGTPPTSVALPVKNEAAYFKITDAAPAPRRKVVDIDLCNSCHGHVNVHGGNRVDNPQVCVICHNPDLTDIGRRMGLGAYNADGTWAGIVAGTAGFVDGKVEQSVDYKIMQHALHVRDAMDGGIREYPPAIYGYGGTVGVDMAGIVYPTELRDCEACHLPGTFDLETCLTTATNVGALPPLGTTVNTKGLTADVAGAVDPVANNGRISAQSASCFGCHDTDKAVVHMARFGGQFGARLAGGNYAGVTQAVINAAAAAGRGESCKTCHGRKEVRAVHGMPAEVPLAP